MSIVTRYQKPPTWQNMPLVTRGWHLSLKYVIIKKYEYKQCFNKNNYKIEVDINETYLFIHQRPTKSELNED